MINLPIDEHVPAVLDAVRSGSNVVIEAAPGAGKTTRIPPALLSICSGQVLVLEPRRVAARMAARRVADELRVKVGGAEVGYQVRFEEVATAATRLRFLTEGVLTRRLVSDHLLAGVSIVILDEFHERHLDTDLALALLRRLQKSQRTDLRLVVMSATLDADPVARYLDGAVRIRSEGRLHPIQVDYWPSTNAPLEQQVAAAAETTSGDTLVFLPGAAEIRKAQRACEPLARKSNLLVTPLYGDLSPEQQDIALLPAKQRKLILSTNIAESSVTIDGVTAVIDSGLARVAADSPWTGLPSLEVAKISRASAIQRAGRAGRTAPGRVTRLYSQEDFARRPEFDTPEIRRRELSQVLLDLHALGIDELEWFEPPPPAALAAAERLLDRLGAMAGETARAMAKLPLHPRLARLLVEAQRRNAFDEGCAAAAVLSAGERLAGPPRHDSPSDVLLLIEAEWQQPNTRRIYDQLRRSGRSQGRGTDEALGLSILAAFPDRLAKRKPGTNELTLAGGGGSAVLSDQSACRTQSLVVAVEVEQRRDRGLPLVRIGSGVEPEWLIELFPEQVEERSGVEWNRGAERVDAVSSIVFDGLTIEESRGAVPDRDKAGALLAEKAIEADIGRFADREELTQLLARAAFVSQHSHLPEIDVAGTLVELCHGLRSFAELANANLLRVLQAKLPRLDELAPSRIRLAGGRNAKVEYALGQVPWVSSRLQDFFGMKETPKLLGVPLVVHLLAPNHRPVQVTSDLAGFWERLYPQVRRELGRRYPRHAWPEKP